MFVRSIHTPCSPSCAARPVSDHFLLEWTYESASRAPLENCQEPQVIPLRSTADVRRFEPRCPAKVGRPTAQSVCRGHAETSVDGDFCGTLIVSCSVLYARAQHAMSTNDERDVLSLRIPSARSCFVSVNHQMLTSGLQADLVLVFILVSLAAAFALKLTSPLRRCTCFTKPQHSLARCLWMSECVKIWRCSENVWRPTYASAYVTMSPPEVLMLKLHTLESLVMSCNCTAHTSITYTPLAASKGPLAPLDQLHTTTSRQITLNRIQDVTTAKEPMCITIHIVCPLSTKIGAPHHTNSTTKTICSSSRSLYSSFITSIHGSGQSHPQILLTFPLCLN